MPKSVPYDDFLMAKLKDKNYAAVYLETHFELEKGEEPDRALLALALKDVAQALDSDSLTPEQAQLHQEKLDKLLADGGSDVIYGLAAWLQSLGLKLTVQVADNKETEETVETDSHENVAVTV
jgi:DNA-binding phage protein